MNLEFEVVREVERDGVAYVVQRARLHPAVASRFWSAYRACGEEMRRLVSPRREGGAWYVYRLRERGSGSVAAFPAVYALKSTDKLLPYQPAAVSSLCAALLRHNAAADGSDTGIGKTYVALAVCREFGVRPAVVCKKSGIAGWKRACAYMEAKALFIINWEQAKTGRFAYASRSRDSYSGQWRYRWNLPAGVMLIFDEVHVANHSDSQNCALYEASKGLTSLSLSATFADRPSRLQSLFHVLGIVDRRDFRRWLLDNGHFVNQYRQMESFSEQQDLLEVHKVLYPGHGCRVSYQQPEVKRHFPEAVYRVNVLSLSPKETSKHNAIYRDMLHKVARYRLLGKQAEALVEDLRYRQAAELFKCETICEMVEEYLYEGWSVCVFVNFRETLSYLAKRLRTKSLVYGGQEQHGLDRDAVIEAFQANRERVLLAIVGAGGQSIDLHDLHGGHPRMSLVCPTYDPIMLKQVMGRTYRAGSKSTPVVQLVYAAGTVEAKVADRVNAKLANIAALNDGDLMEPDIFGLMHGENRK